MERARTAKDVQCVHNALKIPDGLAFITFEGSSSGSSGFASALWDVMPARVLQGVCRFNLATPKGMLANCLAGHRAAVLIDSIDMGAAPSRVSILDLSTMIERALPLNLGSAHGLALAEELKEAKRSNRLPGRIIFFEFEVDSAARPEDYLKPFLSVSVKNSSLLLETVIETLKKEACNRVPAGDAVREAQLQR